MKKIIALILAVASVFSLATFNVSAEAETENAVVISNGNVDFVFEAGVTEDHIHSFVQSFETHDGENAATYGLICTLFGHKIESSTVYTVTHEARATDPRCLKRYYYVETCTRCDYTSKELINTDYISCC